jgi:hypothetical protein
VPSPTKRPCNQKNIHPANTAFLQAPVLKCVRIGI